MKNNNNDLTFSKFSLTNVTRTEKLFHPINSWSPTDWGCALAGETGEACNFIKKLKRLDFTPNLEQVRDLKIKIGKELADIICYADLLATSLGLNLGEEVIKKFNEVSDRHNSDIKL